MKWCIVVGIGSGRKDFIVRTDGREYVGLWFVWVGMRVCCRLFWSLGKGGGGSVMRKGLIRC